MHLSRTRCRLRRGSLRLRVVLKHPLDLDRFACQYEANFTRRIVLIVAVELRENVAEFVLLPGRDGGGVEDAVVHAAVRRLPRVALPLPQHLRARCVGKTYVLELNNHT